MLPETLLFAPAGSVGATLAAALFGLLIGSFLNVVIYRIPKMMQRESDNYVAHESGKELPHTDRFNLMVPRSACPHCGHQITRAGKHPRHQLAGAARQMQRLQGADLGALPGHRTADRPAVGADGVAVRQRLDRPGDAGVRLRC